MAQLPDGFTRKQVAENIDPTHMTEADDGRIFITEKKGNVRILKNDTLLATPLLTIAVDNYGERGLQGIALDPSFGTNQYFYVYYTVPGANHNRVSRFKASGDYADPNSELILIEIDSLLAEFHNGGAMEFGNDGKLYITTGDGNNFWEAQSFSSLLGKVLRINSDGSIPEDNPYYNSTQGKYKAIYALGFRNPFNLTINQTTGAILINEVGSADFEEVDVLYSGKNYGWPLAQGKCPESVNCSGSLANYQDPLYTYAHELSRCAVVGGSFYVPSSGSQFPEKYFGKYFFGDYCSNEVRVLDPETGLVIESFVNDIYRPIGILTSNDGSMYMFSRGGIGNATQEDNSTSNDGSLWKITYTGSGFPSIYRQPASNLVSVGESASFSIAASGVAPLNYQWLQDGVEIESATNDTLMIENTTLEMNGAVFSCKITNSEGTVVSNDAILTVTSNTRPQLTIILPDDTYKYKAGDTLKFKGSATDLEDGTISKASMSWKIDFHHNDHTHPALSLTTNIDSSAFIIPLVGETSPNVWYRVYFSATDSEGLNKTLYKDVFPFKSTITLNTNPAGLTLYLDGQPTATPSIFESVVNLTRSFYASPVLQDETNLYVFNNWSGGEISNTLQTNTPASDSTFIANYTAIPLGDGTGLTAQFFNQLKAFNPPANYVGTDSIIDFDWNIESPHPGQVNENNFSALWTGYLKVPQEDDYTFHLLSDDGSRLWINDQLLVDNWSSTSGIEKTGSMHMIPDKYYRIRIEYFDSDALASIKLYWSSSLISKSIIPKNQFYLVNPDNVGPQISFTYPETDFKFLANNRITIKASATDLEDGTLSPQSFRWRVDLNHDEHMHTVLSETSGLDSLSFIAELDEPFETNFFYTVYASVTDQDGVTAEINRLIYPHIASMNIASNIEDVSVKLGDQTLTLPFALELISGTRLSLTPQEEIILNDNKYEFIRWSPEVATDTLIVPVNDVTLSAIYSSRPKLDLVSLTGDIKFSFGDTISVVATANDLEDGIISSKKIHWTVDLIDNDKTYPVIPDTSNLDSLSFVAVQQNNDLSSDQKYLVTISVTDSDGLTNKITTEIFPSLSEVSYESNISGVSIDVNGVSTEVPSKVNYVTGSSITLDKPSTIIQGETQYIFVKWSENVGQGIVTISPSGNIITAIYNAIPSIKITSGVQKFTNEQTLSIKASANDLEDGQIDSKKLVWKMEFFDMGELQSSTSYTNVDSLSFTVDINSDSFQDVWYRITASVTDSDNSSANVVQDVYPNLVNVGLMSNIGTIPFKWNSETINSPSIFSRIQGTRHQVTIPRELKIDDQSYSFDSWLNNNSTDTTISIQLVESATILTAIYNVVTGINSTDSNVNVYPNPFSKNINIKWNKELTTPVMYLIFDAMGKQILKLENGLQSNELNLRDLSKGIYFLIIHSENSIHHFKIVKTE